MRGRLGVLTVTTMALVAVAAAPASADVRVHWDMEERSGRTMQDASGNGLDGQIGSDVEIGELTPAGTRAYRFRNDGQRTNDERLVQIPDDDRLDPGTTTYAVTMRVKTGSRNPNIIQKGQQRTSGGMWKFVMKKGWPRCHFKDRNGKILAIGFVNSNDPDTILSDGIWHTIRCELTTTGVRVTMDYGTPNAISRFKRGSLASIDNSFPLTIGGKVACNGMDVTCDYFTGAIDWVTIETGPARL